ncbi:MAG: hypothetical protein P8P42_08325 [Gammaproteobacteria bacterium]|nr:hypothetical protein [Gammaproteobacteria bacterium]
MKFKKITVRHFRAFYFNKIFADCARIGSICCERIRLIGTLTAGFYLFTVLNAFVFTSSVHAALDRVSDFALVDTRGNFHQFSRYRHLNGIVMMSFDEKCEQMPQAIERLRQLENKFLDSNLVFLLIDAQGRDRNDIDNLPILEGDKYLPLLEDDGQLVSELLDFKEAGEIRVLNPGRLNVYFEGGLSEIEDDSTLSSMLANLQDAPPSNTVVQSNQVLNGSKGCPISFPDRDEHKKNPPSYSTDVAPIIIEKCAECHRQDGVGPFAMDSYIMLLGWSPMIREVLLNKRMPPAQVDPYFGYSEMARYLSDAERQTIVHWIDNRAPRGDDELDPLAEHAEKLKGETTDWIIGDPDFIVSTDSNAVPPTGVMDYLYSDVELPFAEDRWLRALQFEPGDSSVLHHLMAFVTEPEEDFWGEERNKEVAERRFVEGFSPGSQTVTEFDLETGVFIPAGHQLSLQFHYVTNGQSTEDITQIGLYFADAPPKSEQLVIALSKRFVLPPNKPNFELEAEHVVGQDIVVTGVRARMSYRGKKMKFVVSDPDGREEVIFSVPAYNYGWQPHYKLEQPVSIAAGSTLRVVGALDNSVSNPTNPDPDKEIASGFNSWEEMFTGYFTYYQKVN